MIEKALTSADVEFVTTLHGDEPVAFHVLLQPRGEQADRLLRAIDDVALGDSRGRTRSRRAERRRGARQAARTAFTGEYTDTKTEGVYSCRACGAELFTSDTKFESHCGWPSFYDPKDTDSVELVEDRSHGMVRTEVRCARCGSHLGHVFEGEGYPTPTDQRYCINSISLTLRPAGS
ncbi:Peptide methionine sulfoxide reductase MsrB [Streptomyces griseoloalbus]